MEHRFNRHCPSDDDVPSSVDESTSLMNPFASIHHHNERIRQRGSSLVTASTTTSRHRSPSLFEHSSVTTLPSDQINENNNTTHPPRHSMDGAMNKISSSILNIFDPYAPEKKFDTEPSRTEPTISTTRRNTGTKPTGFTVGMRGGSIDSNNTGSNRQNTIAENSNSPTFSSLSAFSQKFYNPLTKSGTSSMPLPMMTDHHLDIFEHSEYASQPGVGGLLEIEEDDDVAPSRSGSNNNVPLDDLTKERGCEPVRTTSGLLLTHRQTPIRPLNNRSSHPSRSTGTGLATSEDFNYRDTNVTNNDNNFNGSSSQSNSHSRRYYRQNQPMEFERQRRLLTYTRIWLAGLVVVIVTLLGASVIVIQNERRHYSNDEAATVSRSIISNSSSLLRLNESQILSVDEVENVTEAEKTKETTETDEHHVTRKLRRLRDEFEEWIEHHKRDYGSHEEKERRFQIWTDNHHRTVKKNEKHGPCRLTNRTVFGSNHFKDLTPEEFQARYLTGYHGNKQPYPTTATTTQTHGKHHTTTRRPTPEPHPLLQKTYINNWQESKTGNGSAQRCRTTNNNRHMRRGLKTYINNWKDSNYNQNRYCKEKSNARSGTWNGGYHTTSTNTGWWSCGYLDIMCWVNWLLNRMPYGGGGSTNEPEYDEDNLPDYVDWREAGAVTSTHSQGNCGACWAIAAVETIESAYFIAKGTLLDLAESEVIVCEEDCNMCYGGWPQNAYDYVIDNGGLPLDGDISYDGDFLLAMTMVVQGESDEVSEEYVQSYMSDMCPAGGHSGDSSSSYARYGAIKSYAYATDRCVCYSNGSGCSCENQDEELAIANIASYGPATVCLEASTWQDYEGGVITSNSGCTSEFMDMNHCVQVVGYRFYDDDDDGRDLKSGSGSNDGGREGYWIVRNQWSSYWGMNGYAYVAFGGEHKNTCGFLNDMTQAFVD